MSSAAPSTSPPATRPFGPVSALLALLVFVGVPLLLWQTAGREGMFLSDHVVRRGVVRVEKCRPTVFPVLSMACEGPVRWSDTGTWDNRTQVALGSGDRATISTPRSLTGDAEVVSRVSRTIRSQHEVVVVAAQRPGIPAWWWLSALLWLPLVWVLVRVTPSLEAPLWQGRQRRG